MVKTNLINQEEFHIFGVYDGHGIEDIIIIILGAQGHLISNFVKLFVVEYFNKKELYFDHLTTPRSKQDREKVIYEKLIEDNYYILRLCYFKAEQELSNNNKYDASFSGTTANTVIIIGKTRL